MKLYAGIDGGQSSTTAVVAGADGKILGVGNAGPADEVAQDASSTRLHDAFAHALRDALSAAGAPPATQFACVVAGLSGYNGTLTGRAPEINARTFRLLHDSRIAHAAAFGTSGGVLAIAGTGSVAFGVNDEGLEVRVGGWGYLFGDEGSAFWIGRRLIERAMHDEDLGLPSPVRAPLLQHFCAGTVREISDAFYAGRIRRAEIAAAAKIAGALAESGTGDALFIMEQAADAIAALAALCARRLHGNMRTIGREVAVACSGGLMNSPVFAQRVAVRLRDRLPEARLVRSELSAAAGALLLAYDADGVSPLPAVRS